MDYSECGFLSFSEDCHCRTVKRVVVTVGVTSAVFNLVIIYVLLKTKELRKNSANIYIISILMVNLLLLAALPFLKKVNIGRVVVLNFDLFISFILQAKTPGIPNSFWRFSISHTFFAVQINLQLLLSFDRFWAICFPISYFLQKTPRRKILGVLACITICICFGLFSGIYICAIHPIYDPRNNNTLTSCTNYKEYKAFLKELFSGYMTTAMLIIISLNGFIIHTVIKRVSMSHRRYVPSSLIFSPSRGALELYFSKVTTRRRRSLPKR